MTSIHALLPSKFLRTKILQNLLAQSGDSEYPVTIARIVMENAGTDAKPEQKPVMYFTGEVQGLIVNATNARLLEDIFGSDEIEVWIGKRVNLWVDMSVTYMGQPDPGIRFRAIGPAANYHATLQGPQTNETPPTPNTLTPEPPTEQKRQQINAPTPNTLTPQPPTDEAAPGGPLPQGF